jgi:hypothetical protein
MRGLEKDMGKQEKEVKGKRRIDKEDGMERMEEQRRASHAPEEGEKDFGISKKALSHKERESETMQIAIA